MAEKIDLSIIIVSFNTKKLTEACIESVIKYTKGITFEILVIDNASTDGSSQIQGEIKMIRNKTNVGFGKANNQGIKIARGKYILLLNSDTELLDDVFKKMISWMDKHTDAGVASCNLVDRRGRLQLNGGNFPDIFRLMLWSFGLDDIPGVSIIFGSFHSRPVSWVREQDWVSGAFFLMRSEVVKKIGNFDEKIFLYGEEVEYCFRIKRAGWKVYFVPIFKIKHLGFASGGGNDVKFFGHSIGKESGLFGEFEGIKYFYKKHFPDWQYLIMRIILKMAALVRILVFGILGGQKEARRIYAKVFSMA